MSGYFQRLTQAVMQPTQRVHPMVGSFFTPVSQELEPEPSLEFTQSATAPQKAEFVQSRSEPVEERRDESPTPAARFLRPLIALENVEAKMPARQPVEAGLEPPARVVRHELKVTAQPEVPAIDAQKTFAPLMPLSPRAVPAPATRHTQPLSQAVRKADKPTSTGAQREADDIQIHIGRVEVIAVPPTPAPAAAKAPRKSATSLDDYLRRRDRRPL